jgi:transaldolase
MPPQHAGWGSHGTCGVDVCTIPMEVLEQLYHHPMSDVIIEQFTNDWSKVPGK